MLSAKQGGIKYHFFESLIWLDLGLNFGLPQTIGEHSTHLGNGLVGIIIWKYGIFDDDIMFPVSVISKEVNWRHYFSIATIYKII